ncbi:MAG: type II secretion system F family protein [Opitutaceae bacterium]|nr:type II secretion system F family protein [Opitutaceae bacterium]
MPRFTYTARDAAGQTVRATLEAPARKDAVRLLAARGLQVVDLAEAAAAAPAARSAAKAAPEPARTAGGRGAGELSTRERLPFLQALSDLIASGMPAGEAVRLLSLRLKEPRLRRLCASLWERLGEGLPLSQALATLPQVFDPQTINLIAAGEATGNLKEVLLRLIQHFTEQKELRQKLTAALAYPAFICLVAISVILFFIFFLMPRLQALLTSLGGKLPFATQLLVGVSHFMLSYGVLVLVALGLGATAFWQWRRTEAGRAATDAWLLRLPVAGTFLTSSTVHNFSQTLAVLLENGVTTAEALRMTERTLTHRPLRRAFGEATDRVLEGEKLSQALARTGCFPDLVLDRLAVGESTGNLAPSLRDIARTYQQILSRQVQAFTTIVSSGVLLFAFSFVAFIAYAIVSAVFQVSASFKF